MKPVWKALVAGLLATGAGCSNLRQGQAFRPATERVPAAGSAAPHAEGSGPIDPFHAESQTPTAWFTRHFPALSRAERPAHPGADPARKPRAIAGVRDRRLEAVPRPDPGPVGESIAALPRRSRGAEPRPADLADRGVRTAADHLEADEPMPVLAGSVVAEGDTGDERPIPERRTAIARPNRMAEAAPLKVGTYGMSIRRMPVEPLGELAAERVLSRPVAARESAEPDTSPLPSRPVAREGDIEARRARVEIAEADPVPATEPVAERNLDPPQIDPGPADEPREPAPARARRTDPEPTAEPEVQPDSVADAPPPIATEAESRDEPATPGRTRPSVVSDRAAGSDAGPAPTRRPRAGRGEIVRDSLPPDLPPVRFPRTYYDGGTTPTANPTKRDEAALQARWTWTPRILRRLRGDN